MLACSVLSDDGNLCGEAPLWDAKEECLYWTDCGAGKFYCLDWSSKRHSLILGDFEVNGCALDESDSLILVNNSGAWLWNKNDQPVLIVDVVGDEKLQLNDCIADPRGRLLAGSCFYSSSEQYPLGKLVCVEPDGSVKILDEGFHLPNGLGFSLDQCTLYFADSVAHKIYAYTYEPLSGTVRDRRIFVDVDRNSGVPDGLTVDAEGFVWSAQWYGSCISRYDPDGKLERQLRVPAKQTSSLAFGGTGLTDIFITTAARSEPMPVMPENYDFKSGYFGGALFHVASDIRGRLEYRTRMTHKSLRASPKG